MNARLVAHRRRPALRSFIIIIRTKFAPTAALVLIAALLAACGGGGGGSAPAPAPTVVPTVTPTVVPTATSAPTTTPNPQAFACPATQGTTTAVARSAALTTHRFGRHVANQPAAGDTTQLAISYSRPTLTAGLRQVEGREAASGVTYVNSIDFPNQNMTTRIVSVPTSKVAATTALFRAQAGVTSVGVTGQRRFSSTSAAHWTSDSYFTGQGAVFKTLPYAENQTITGQWDMHAIGLEHAFGYADPGATVAQNPAALGSSAIKIAIIDTGEDATHIELLSSKIAYQKCFVTNLSGVQNTGNFANDPQGHGTDVSGIAAAALDNGVGFAGAGGNAVIYAYRVFPTPDDTCENASSTSLQCSSDTGDIARAINDAVAQHVNIISMSLGGGQCSAGGVDSDPVENTAVNAALTAGVIVIAAAGNGGNSYVDAPGCITGVIAVGASALNDGVATGTTAYTRNVTGASASNVLEYVPSYSQAGTTNVFRGVNSWGIVAPGGDPSDFESSSSTSPVDYLHWIENIWTSTPFDSNFAGACTADYAGAYPGLSPTTDCRTLIAGTSMSTPHVAGAAALILAANAGYGTPAAMKSLLCSTADDLGDSRQGCGRLNLYRAMAIALHDPTPP
jgi:subtilisin family serine protease